MIQDQLPPHSFHDTCWCGWAAVSGLLSVGPHHKESSAAQEASWKGTEVHRQHTGKGKVGRGLKCWGLRDHLNNEMGVTSTGCEVAGEECASQLVPPTAPAPSCLAAAEIRAHKDKQPLPHSNSRLPPQASLLPTPYRLHPFLAQLISHNHSLPGRFLSLPTSPTTGPPTCCLVIGVAHLSLPG